MQNNQNTLKQHACIQTASRPTMFKSSSFDRGGILETVMGITLDYLIPFVSSFLVFLLSFYRDGILEIVMRIISSDGN